MYCTVLAAPWVPKSFLPPFSPPDPPPASQATPLVPRSQTPSPPFYVSTIDPTFPTSRLSAPLRLAHLTPGSPDTPSLCLPPPPSLPAGITISAKASGQRAPSSTTTASEATGTYSVGPLLPGDYVITASHPHWQLQPASMTHRLGLDSPQVAAPFAIQGYRLTGKVTSRSGPVAGIQVCVCMCVWGGGGGVRFNCSRNLTHVLGDDLKKVPFTIQG
jgi:hypothetical protein